MSTVKRICIFLSVCLIVLFSITFPTYAVDTDYTFNFLVPNAATNFDGYVIVPLKLTNGEITADIFFWEISSSHTIDGTDVSTIGDLQVNVTVDNSNLYFDFITSNSQASYIVTLYQSRSNGTLPIQKHSTQFVSSSSPWQPSFGGVTYYKSTQFSGVLRLTNNTRNTLSYDTVFSDNNAEFNELVSVNEHFVSMLQKQDLTNEQLNTLLEQFNYLLESVYNLDYYLYDFVYYYWSEFTTNDLPFHFYGITSRLDKIYDLLKNFEWGEITTSFSEDLVSEFDDVEGNINDNLDNPELESFFDGIELDTSTGAFEFIWNLISSCFNSHPEVMGLVSTILVFGLIALILNR